MFLVIVLLSAEGIIADYPSIKINIVRGPNDSGDCKFTVPRDLILYEEFNMPVNGNVELKSGGCHCNENKTQFPYANGFLTETNPFTTHLLKASLDMNSIWKCEFFDSRYYSIKCTYDFNIVRNPAYGQLKINEMILPINYTQRKEVYHTYGNYSFTNGELAKIKCYRKEKEYDYVYKITLSYIYANQTVASGPFDEAVEMSVKLTKEIDGAAVECNITKRYIYSELKQYYVTRIYFQFNSTKRATLGFQVNGLPLNPTQMKSEEDFTYKYFYYKGEELEIISLKDEQRYGKMECEIPKELKCSYLSENNNYLHLVSKLELNKEISIKCKADLIYLPYQIKTRSKTKYAVIFLAPVPHDKSGYIEGLSLANILLQYKETSYSTVIDYEYDDAKNLSLTFYSVTNPKIESNSSEVEIIDFTYPIQYVNSHYEVSAIFKLNPNRTNSEIKYTSEDFDMNTKTIRLRLIRKNDRTVENIEQDVMDVNDATKQSIVIFAACGIALFITVLVTLIKITFQKWKQNIRFIPETTDMNYDTLPAHNGGEMPAPIQWSEEHTMRDIAERETNNAPNSRNVNEMYTTPLPKHLRQRPAEIDLTYAELQLGCFEDPAYATVQHPGPQQDAANYVKVVHKNTKPSTGSKNKSNVRKKNIDEPDQGNSSPSAQYVNSFDNESYINAHSTDVEEPTYCEVNVKK